MSVTIVWETMRTGLRLGKTYFPFGMKMKCVGPTLMENYLVFEIHQETIEHVLKKLTFSTPKSEPTFFLLFSFKFFFYFMFHNLEK